MYGGSRQTIIVAGVDGSGESLVGAHWAANEAMRRRFRLRLVHGFTDPPLRFPGSDLPQTLSHELHNTAQQVLDLAAHSISASFPHLEVTTSLVHADPRRVLVDASAGALLTVVGSRGRGRVPEVLLGSVALHLASHGRSPVAVVPSCAIPDGAQGAGPILLGVDASVGCEDAIGYAFDEANARGVELIAALVVDDSTVPPFVRGPARAGSLADQQEHEVLTTQISGWARQYPGVTTRELVLRGRPAAALVDYGLGLPPGGGPCMVVIGGRGRGGLAGLLLGSTGQNLITHAEWPVVVVRPGTAGVLDELRELTSTQAQSLASAE